MIRSLLVTLLVAGCTSIHEDAVTPKAEAPPGTESAAIFIDGKIRGNTPATVNIRRGFSEYSVTLNQGKRRVRTFEIEWGTSGEGSGLQYSFGAYTSGGYISYNLEDLPTRKDTIHVIPYFPHPVRVEDRQYGLTIIVTE